MNKQRIVSNLMIIGSGQVATWVMSMGYVVIVSNYLGPTHLGALLLAQSIVGVLALAIQLGLETLVTRRIAQAPEQASVTISASLAARAILAIPTPIVLFVCAQIVHLNAETSAAMYILMIGMIATTFGGLLAAMFQGYEAMSFIAVGSLAHNVIGLVLAGLIVLIHGNVVTFAVSQTIADIAVVVLYLRWSRRFLRLTANVSWYDLRDMVAGSLPFWVNNLFLTFYVKIDMVILGAIAGTQAAGYYGPPTTAFGVALFVPTIVGMVTLPLLSRLGVDAATDFDRVGRKTLSLLIATSVPMTIGLVAFAGPVITLVLHSRFQDSVPVLMVLALCLPWTFLDIQFGWMLTARNQQWRWTVVMAISCILNPLLNLVLIPVGVHLWHNGALGAAVALLITEFGMSVYGVITLRKIMLHPVIGRTVVGALIAGAAQAVVLRVVGTQWVIVGEALGALVYLAVAISLGALARQDVELMVQTALRRPQRTAA